MVINDLSLPNGGPQRISFAQASSLLVAQALTDANARLVRHFPTLSGATWGNALRQLQPDLVVHGAVVAFDWHDLARRVQRLVLDPELPALAPPTNGPPVAESAAQLRTYQRQAVPALAELQAILRVHAPLAYALLTQLAHAHGLAAGIDDAIQGVRQHQTPDLCPSVLEPLELSTGPAEATVDLPEERRQGPGLVQRLSRMGRKNTLGPAPRRKRSKQRTFRDIVEHHPRGNGKFGFTVRELCATMRISAASLTEARKNPGHLSVEKVVALADAMGEHPLRVLSDILTEAAGKKRRLRKERVMQPQHPENSCWR